jgi:hypothetical protein
MMFLALALQAATSAPAACTATDADLPANLAGWTQAGTSLSAGRAITMAAVDPASVKLVGVAAPKEPGRVFSVVFSVPRAGVYGIALDQKGWIDVYPASADLLARAGPDTSMAHGHGPACSTIRKVVRYRLAAGSYRLVVSGLQRDRAKVMLVTGG